MYTGYLNLYIPQPCPKHTRQLLKSLINGRNEIFFRTNYRSTRIWICISSKYNWPYNWSLTRHPSKTILTEASHSLSKISQLRKRCISWVYFHSRYQTCFPLFVLNAILIRFWSKWQPVQRLCTLLMIIITVNSEALTLAIYIQHQTKPGGDQLRVESWAHQSSCLL